MLGSSPRRACSPDPTSKGTKGTKGTCCGKVEKAAAEPLQPPLVMKMPSATARSMPAMRNTQSSPTLQT